MCKLDIEFFIYLYVLYTYSYGIINILLKSENMKQNDNEYKLYEFSMRNIMANTKYCIKL